MTGDHIPGMMKEHLDSIMEERGDDNDSSAAVDALYAE